MSNTSFLENIQIDSKQLELNKTSFWIFLSASAVFIGWVVFITFYLSRIVGLFISFWLNRALRISKTPGHVRIGSVSISLLGGKLMFRDFVYANNDYSIRCNDGWIIFSYWRSIPRKTIDYQDLTSRLHVSLNGLQLHLYNKSSRYREIARLFNLEKFFPSDDYKKVPTVPDKAEKSNKWDRIWALVGVIKLDIWSGRLVVGNDRLPYMFALSWENMTSKVRLSESTADRALLNVEGQMENINGTFYKHSDYQGKTYKEPPRIMNDGFSILSSAHLTFFYRQDILGYVVNEQQTTDKKDRPVWESFWRFGPNTVISYGPWAEQQRALLYSFFFPPDFQSAQADELPKRGNRRIHIMHDVRVMFLKGSEINIWFMRGQSLESIQSTCQPGSTIDLFIWWITREDGFSWSAKFSLVNVVSNTCLSYRKLLQCETLRIETNIHYPRCYNAKQTWTLNYSMEKATAWFTWDHKRFFTDLIDEWIGDAPSDISLFVPYTVSTELVITKGFEVILLLNEGNWVDPAEGSSENVECAITGERLNFAFLLPFDDFLPKTLSVHYSLNAENEIALRLKYPSNSSTAAMLSSLMRAARTSSYASRSSHGTISKGSEEVVVIQATDSTEKLPAASKDKEIWHEMWRTERISCTFDHTYHPICAEFEPLLPRQYLEKWLPKKAPHPKELKPDSLSVKLDFDGSEVMFTGLLIKAIIELKNNYFGYYDSMTDIHDADKDGVNSISVFNRLGVRPRVEMYRPMDVTVDLRVHNIRAQCLVYSPCSDEPCPVFYTEEVAVEIKKTYHETLIQVGVGPCAVHFEKSAGNQSDGFLTLSSFQFRGHAMFSPVEVPYDMGILEYGWIMEILVGDVTGSLEIPNHLAALYQVLESLLLFVLSKDDNKKAPARFNVCQHGQLVTYCSKSSLPKNVCEGEERLKYRALRLAVDGVKLSLCEEKTVTELSLDPIRFTLCNGHDGKYTENICIRVPFLQIRHVFIVDQVGGNGLEVACIGINGVNINLELPHPDGDLLSNARCDFMRKHDRETKRLAFLWTDTAVWCCACYGATIFFGADDVIGKDFLSIKKDGMRKICVPNITSSGQPGVLQDLLKTDEFMLHQERHNFYPPKRACKEAKVVTPLISSADSSSFHSALSQQKDNRPTSNVALMKEYGSYLTRVEVIRPLYEAPRFVVPGAIGAWIENKVILLNKVLVGLDNVRMNAEHNQSQMTVSRQGLASARPSVVSLTTNNRLVIQGSVANSIEMFVCPVALDCAERITHSITSWFRDLHPGFLIQMRYRDCVLGNHRQPLTSVLFPTAPTKVSLDVSLKLPKLHLSLFQCGQLDHLGLHHSDTDSDRIQPMSSNMVVVVLDGANFTTSSQNVRVDNGSNGNNVYALQSSSISSQLVQFIPANAADFATNTAKSTFKSSVQWKDSPSSSRTALSPRVVVDFFIPDVVVSLQQKDSSLNSVHPSPKSNQRRTSSTQPLPNLSQETTIKVDVGEMIATIVMARALEHTSKYEFPIYDVLSPGITTWLTVAYRLNMAVEKLHESWNSWKDLTMARVMKYAFECNDERIFGGIGQKNLMDSVKLLGKHQASCPSCKLLMILMRWCSLPSSSDIIGIPVAAATALNSEKDRKSAILALLKHWQPDISALVKLSSPEDVVRFSSDADAKCKEVKINIDTPEVIDKDARPIRHRRTESAVSNRNLPRDGNVKRDSDVDGKNDLYRWIASAHKERHEKKDGKKRGDSANKDVNPLLDIVPHAFFYALYRAHRLDWTNLDNVPFDSFKITYEFTVSGLVAELIEPKLMPSSHGSILLAAQHPHRLLVVKKVILSGDLTWLIEMDEKDLMPVRGRATLNYTGLTSRVQFGVVMPSFCVAKELILVGNTASDTISELQKDAQCLLTPSSIRSVTTAKPAMDKLRWDEHLLEMAREYEKRSQRDSKSRRGDVISRVRGQFTIEDVCLESKLTDLYVSLDIKNIDLTQDHTPPEHSPNNLNVSSDLDKLNVKLRKARLDIRESISDFRNVNRASVNESKTILQCSLKESSATLARKVTILIENQNKIDTSLSVLLGCIEGELPMAAHSLHEVVLRHGPQLEQQLDRLSAQPQSVLSPMHPGSHPGTSETIMDLKEIDATTYKRPSARRELSLTRNAPIAQIAFSFAIQKVALKACLLPSLTAKYIMNQAVSKGVTGSEANWSASIEDHSAKFHITSQKTPDTFELALPSVSVIGQYLTEEKEVTNGAPNTDKQLHYRQGGFLKMVVTLGQVNHSFTTELLNHILFAEQTFRSELSSLVQRLNKERDRPSLLSPVVTSPVPVAEKPRLLFFLTVKGAGIPWLQLTAATPTNTAVRFTMDSLEMELTNRWVVKDEDSSRERIFGAAVIQFNAKLGQLVKPAQYEEIQAELQEYATFMTQIRMENKESSRKDSYSYLISLNRPILLIKSTAIDKAILLWLNYKNTYDYWRTERSRFERSTQKRQSISHSLFPPQPTQDVNINLSLTINNGMYVCMPLIGNDITEGMPALVLSLQKSDVTITIKKELACQAQFHGFKLRFIDNFDEQALSNFNQSIGGDVESNYFFFPQGSYKLCSKATNETGDAKWVLSVRSHMRGMVIDLDQRIGKFGKMLVKTFASLGEEEDGELYEESSLPATSMNDSDLGTQEHAELRKLPADGRIPWMERKLHEQSRLVSDLMARKANEKLIETERRKLRQFEMIRFKEFSRSMVDKIRRRNDHREGKRSNTVSEVPPSPFEHKPAPVSRTESDVDARTAHSSSSATTNLGKAQDTVSMHIDVQVNIESGTCTLRSIPKQDQATTLVKRPSAKDLLRSKPTLAHPSSCTKFSIPSVDLKGLYTSPGSDDISPRPDFQHPTFTLSDHARRQFIKASKRACFYLSVSLSSMPSETVITPHLADYLEQVLEPLPVSMGVRSESVTSVADASEPPMANIVGMDTSVLPIDVLIYFIVQSSTIRFDGQQQRSSAADCQLKLPSLSLVASTRTDGGVEYLGGIDISIRLDKFSLSIYSPHQSSTSYDALSLALDHLSLVISRSKNSSSDNDNRVRFVLTSNIGTANFKYDMRRLNELMAFPKPWYRRAIARRIFFGDQSAPAAPPSATGPTLSRQSTTASQATHRKVDKMLSDKPWSATVLLSAQWKELQIEAQMSNTMGKTNLIARKGVLRGRGKLNSKHERNITTQFKLDSSELTAHGGAISGDIFLSRFEARLTHSRSLMGPPTNKLQVSLNSIATRMEWMSRAVLIAKCDKPSITLGDEFSEVKDENGEVNRVSVALNVKGAWDDLQVVINRNTVEDFKRMVNKLKKFFEEQLSSSKKAWTFVDEAYSSEQNVEDDSSEEDSGVDTVTKHWERLLDTVTDIQFKFAHIIAYPKRGETIVGGSVDLEAGRFSLACMHGEMNATSWALFHMNNPSILFSPEAQFCYIADDRNQLGVSVKQQLIIGLGRKTKYNQPSEAENMASVCRVVQGRKSVMRQNASISASLDYLIGDALKKISLDHAAQRGKVATSSTNSQAPASSTPVPPYKPQHEVLELFQFPGLEAVLTSLQTNECTEEDKKSADTPQPEVHLSFHCDFHSAVYLQTDFTAQATFLPELLKSYIHINDAPEPTNDAVALKKGDKRLFKCDIWTVNPNIRFIDLAKFTPPLIDDILRKLQIFDHRTTIPKALQRALLDPLDASLCIGLQQMLRIVEQSEQDRFIEELSREK